MEYQLLSMQSFLCFRSLCVHSTLRKAMHLTKMHNLCDDQAIFLPCLHIQNFISAPNYSPEGHSPFLCLLKTSKKGYSTIFGIWTRHKRTRKIPALNEQNCRTTQGKYKIFPLLIKKSSLNEALFSRIVHKKLQQQQHQQQRVSQRKRRRHWTTASPEHGRRGATVGDIAKEDWEYLLITMNIYNGYIFKKPTFKVAFDGKQLIRPPGISKNLEPLNDYF
jgi:hypothetical protein